MKSLLLSLFILCGVCGYSQITIHTVERAPEPERVIQPYDSLTNITRDNILSIIGQKLQILPGSPNYGPTIYRSKPRIEYSSLKGSPYSPDGYGLRSTAGAFDNQIFDVIGADSIVIESNPAEIKKSFFLVVSNEKYPKGYLYVGEAKDDMIFNKRGAFSSALDLSHLDQVLILGYYEKLKQLKTGTKIICIYDSNPVMGPNIRRLDNGEKVQFSANQVWTISDVSYVQKEGNGYLSYILESDNLPTSYISCYSAVTPAFEDFDIYQKRLEERKIWERNMIRKYGSVNGKLIIEGKVKLGFSKEMCIEAWGEPRDINKSTGSWGTTEQWIYGNGNYLYFKNGKLTSIDN